jgi:hypothetical protein
VEIEARKRYGEGRDGNSRRGGRDKVGREMGPSLRRDKRERVRVDIEARL